MVESLVARLRDGDRMALTRLLTYLSREQDVDKIEAEFRQHGISCNFYRYEGAGHAFQNFLSEERFRPGPADDAWDRTLAFLRASFAQ